jgi:hypothetical protein
MATRKDLRNLFWLAAWRDVALCLAEEDRRDGVHEHSALGWMEHGRQFGCALMERWSVLAQLQACRLWSEPGLVTSGTLRHALLMGRVKWLRNGVRLTYTRHETTSSPGHSTWLG